MLAGIPSPSIPLQYVHGYCSSHLFFFTRHRSQARAARGRRTFWPVFTVLPVAPVIAAAWTVVGGTALCPGVGACGSPRGFMSVVVIVVVVVVLPRPGGRLLLTIPRDIDAVKVWSGSRRWSGGPRKAATRHSPHGPRYLGCRAPKGGCCGGCLAGTAVKPGPLVSFQGVPGFRGSRGLQEPRPATAVISGTCLQPGTGLGADHGSSSRLISG